MNLHPTRELQRLDERYNRLQRLLESQFIKELEDKHIDFTAERLHEQDLHHREREDLAIDHGNRRRRLRDDHAMEMRRIRHCYRGHYLRRRKEDEERMRYFDENREREAYLRSKKYELERQQRDEIIWSMEYHHQKEMQLMQWHHEAVVELREMMLIERQAFAGPWLR